MPTTLITNARVIDPASGRDETADVAIRDGLVAEIGRDLDRSIADTVIDATDRIVTPGLIDPHVHLREPGGEHKETIETGTRAAVAGGFATVCCMPNTTPTMDRPEILYFVTSRAKETAHCRVFPVAAATVGRQGEQMVEVQMCQNAGAVAFSDDGDVVQSAGMMKALLTTIGELGSVFMQHCQDTTLTQNAAMHAGTVSTKLGLTGWPREAEEIIIERDARLAEVTGCRYHVQHISSAGSVEIVRRARRDGAPITAEATPHHLTLTHEACDGFDTAAKVNPPLRELRDAEAILEGVADGTITILATDHAPHAADEKAAPFEDAPCGMIGLETALSIYIEALVNSGLITWPELIAKMTINPARLCRLDERGLGMLAVGDLADITIIDPDLEWTVTSRELAGMSSNTPFLGRTVRGRAVATLVGGEVVMNRLNPHESVQFCRPGRAPASASF
ncbi:MAG: dihydroorotase [Phycisphaeraceae bacterium]|nr:MAG: dihydroorotase [Phycisphaeraceae bacterium]